MDMLERARARQDKLRAAKDRLEKELSALGKRIAEINSELAAMGSFFEVAAKLSDEASSPVQRGLPAFPFRGRPRSERDLGMVGPPEAGEGMVTVYSHGLGSTGEVPHGVKGRLICSTAADIIQKHGPRSARRILEEMDRAGAGKVLIPGDDEKMRVSYLSAVLSKDHRFGSDRSKGGYVLIEDEEDDTPHPRG